jgi:hypothetical protein
MRRLSSRRASKKRRGKANEHPSIFDGVEIDTSGPLRIVQLNDGFYVVGEGMSIPVAHVQEGENVLAKLREHRS